jgi:hypothetical protein
MASALKVILNTRLAKILPVLLIAGLMATASASVFTQYYGSTTATVRTPDIQLASGPDSTGGSTYPSATVTVSSTSDFATVAISLFPSATNNPQPATYYTNLVQIKNMGAGAHTISQISISGISSTRAGDFGNVTVYYETAQTDVPTTANAAGFLKVTGTTGGNVFSGSQSIAASGTHYLEIVGYAGATAVAGDTITFTLNIKWA